MQTRARTRWLAETLLFEESVQKWDSRSRRLAGCGSENFPVSSGFTGGFVCHGGGVLGDMEKGSRFERGGRLALGK